MWYAGLYASWSWQKNRKPRTNDFWEFPENFNETEIQFKGKWLARALGPHTTSAVESHEDDTLASSKSDNVDPTRFHCYWCVGKGQRLSSLWREWIKLDVIVLIKCAFTPLKRLIWLNMRKLFDSLEVRCYYWVRYRLTGLEKEKTQWLDNSQ